MTFRPPRVKRLTLLLLTLLLLTLLLLTLLLLTLLLRRPPPSQPGSRRPKASDRTGLTARSALRFLCVSCSSVCVAHGCVGGEVCVCNSQHDG
jgi:hypothetical protein